MRYLNDTELLQISAGNTSIEDDLQSAALVFGLVLMVASAGTSIIFYLSPETIFICTYCGFIVGAFAGAALVSAI